MTLADDAQQIVGPEPREATFASNVIRRSCSVAPWPGQLRRYPPPLFDNWQKQDRLLLAHVTAPRATRTATIETS
jgi:hypothetical protein